jgi:hypothetical protein
MNPFILTKSCFWPYPTNPRKTPAKITELTTDADYRGFKEPQIIILIKIEKKYRKWDGNYSEQEARINMRIKYFKYSSSVLRYAPTIHIEILHEIRLMRNYWKLKVRDAKKVWNSKSVDTKITPPLSPHPPPPKKNNKLNGNVLIFVHSPCEAYVGLPPSYLVLDCPDTAPETSRVFFFRWK